MKAVIMAGGTGTRLWPLSRDNSPKQFQAFVGNSTMLQQTYRRLSFLKPNDIYVSTIAEYAPLVKKQLPKLPKKNIIIENAMRDTGPSICYAAWRLAQDGGADDVMAIIYADHLIQKEDVFKASLKTAVQFAKETNRFGVIGVKAQYANVNLGYIHIGHLIEKRSWQDKDFDVYELDRFVEKPNLKKAQEFLNSYKYFWNTGLYVGRVQMFLDNFKKFSPAIYKAIAVNKDYSLSPKISIDYALIEKLDRHSMFVIPANLGWNDIGNWEALYDELATVKGMNVTECTHLSIETNGSLIIAPKGKKVATVGLENMVIIDTPDALLVMPKHRAAQVKDIVQMVRDSKKN